jgi:hypothetical protein
MEGLMRRLILLASHFRNFPAAAMTFSANADSKALTPCDELRSYSCGSVWIQRIASKISAFLKPSYPRFRIRTLVRTLVVGFPSLLYLFASVAQAQVTITANVPAYPFVVLAGSTRQINVNIKGGTLNTVNWSVLSTTGGASATFTTLSGADVSSVAGALPTVQVNIGPTQGNGDSTGAVHR